MQNLKTISRSLFMIASMLTNVGCGSTKVVYVKHGEPVRLAETVKARVWVVDKDGKNIRSVNRIELQEGWYALPK